MGSSSSKPQDAMKPTRNYLSQQIKQKQSKLKTLKQKEASIQQNIAKLANSLNRAGPEVVRLQQIARAI
tara:strand:+ start:1132 stop:1338 length:207 start_codon:yes stop_codon:yes gene_type:complete